MEEDAGEKSRVAYGGWWIIPASEQTPGTASVPAGWLPKAWLRKPGLGSVDFNHVDLPKSFPTKEAADEIAVRIAIQKIDSGEADAAEQAGDV